MALKVRRYQADETESPADETETPVIDTQPTVAVESDADLETELADELADEEDEDTETPADEADESDDDEEDSDEPEQPEKSGDLLTDIFQAEQRCRESESRVNSLKEELKEAKKEYDVDVTKLRKLCSALNEDRPLFKSIDKPAAPEAAPEPVVDQNAWRKVPLSDLDFSSIKGFGPKKQDVLIAACPTMGAFEDLRAGEGLTSLDGIGQTLAGELENAMLSWLSKNRDAAVLASAGAATAAESESDDSEDQYISADDWDSMSNEEQCEYIENQFNAASVLEIPEFDRLPAWKSGYEANQNGLGYSECPYVPSIEMDHWLNGWNASEINSSDNEPVNLDDL